MKKITASVGIKLADDTLACSDSQRGIIPMHNKTKLASNLLLFNFFFLYSSIFSSKHFCGLMQN